MQSHKLDRIGVGRIWMFPFSSDSSYDPVAYNLVKTRLLESEAEMEGKFSTLHVQHTFLVHFFAVVLHSEASRNFWVLRFMEEMSYVFSFTFFSLQLIFTLYWWPLPFLILWPPLQNVHVVLPTKKCLLCFLALALDLWRPFSRWASLACQLIFSFSLSFSRSIFQICGHDN